MVTPSLHNSWLRFLRDQPSHDKENKNFEAFASANRNLFPKPEALQSLVKEFSPPIIAVSPITKKIKLYFGLSNLGGTRIRPATKIVGLEGLNASASAVCFELEAIEKRTNFSIPEISMLTAATLAQEFQAITPPTSAPKQKGALYAIIPPLFFCVLL